MNRLVPKIGVNVFLIQDGQILLGKRLAKTGHGTWCLPGGHFEYGESFIAAAKRELYEETSIIADLLEFAHIINQPRSNDHYVHVNFLAKRWSGTPQVMEPNKCSEWRWFDFEHLPRPIFIGHTQFIPVFLQGRIFVDTDLSHEHGPVTLKDAA